MKLNAKVRQRNAQGRKKPSGGARGLRPRGERKHTAAVVLAGLLACREVTEKSDLQGLVSKAVDLERMLEAELDDGASS